MPPPVNTNFTCKGRDTGFYADVETNCRVYHTCDENGNKFTYYCPAETAFRQEALVCDHAHLVDCAIGRRISTVNKNVEIEGEETSQNFKGTGRYSSSSSPKDSPSEGSPKKAEHRGDAFQPGSSNSAYTRSFRITQESQARFPAPEISTKPKPTFVLSSSVFLRDRMNAQNNAPLLQDNRVPTLDSGKSFNASEYSPGNPANRKQDSSRDRSAKIFSATTPTTTLLPPFDPEFQVKQYFRNPMIFRSSNFAEETKAPVSFRESNPFGGTSGQSTNNEKFKLNYGNGNTRSSTNRAEPDTRMNSKAASAFSFEDKTTRDKKTETGNNFHSMSNGKASEPEMREKSHINSSDFTEHLQKDQSFSKNRERSNKNSKELKISINEQPPFFDDNFRYSETLRSMQAMAENSSKDRTRNSPSSTPSPTTTAGTEFPVHPFPGTFSPLGPNELDDDPYYPKRSTTTEVYYKLRDLRGEEKKSIRFSTKRPWPGSLNFEIPEVLPDLNTLDDLVDRRKFLFIPRVKNT